jgi:putative transposase
MRRTARYETRPLNRGKRRMLLSLVDAFCRVKDQALLILGRTAAWHYLDHRRALRDALKPRYLPDVPVHLQDQAVFDAVDTMRRFVESGLARAHAKARVFRHFEGTQQRYAFWLLKRYGRIGAVLRGEAPAPEHFTILPAERREVARFLRRLLRKSLGTPPRVRIRRSLALDSTLYKAFERKGRSYVAIASLDKRERLVLPLRGRGAIHGTIRVVWDPARGTAAIPMPYAVRSPKRAPTGPILALDAGVTEVLTTNTGEKWGEGYGKLLEKLSEETARTGRARNRLHQLAKQAEAAGDIAKARRIRRHNLGRKQLRKQRAKGEAAIKTVVGRAVRNALKAQPSVVVAEDLTHLRGRTKNRKLSRIVSRWRRSVLRERLEFRTQAGGSRLETVNAAYTSQTCPVPTCGYVHKDNRHGDRFHLDPARRPRPSGRGGSASGR